MSDFKFDQSTRDAIERYRDLNKFRHADMATKLKLSSVTRYTKFVNFREGGAVEHDFTRTQNSARQFLRHLAQQEASEKNLFENPVTRLFDIAMKTCISTADMSLSIGPGGVGKSCASMLFCIHHPTSVRIVASHDKCNHHAMRALVFEQLRYEVDSKGNHYSGNTARWEWIVNILRGSERPIIVDAGERLKLTALEWFCDLNDQTRTPVMFVANEELLRVAAKSDRVTSRIGKVTRFDLGLAVLAADKDATDDEILRHQELTARAMIERHAPGAEELLERAADVLGEGGATRRLEKQLKLSRLIHDGMEKGRKNWEAAWLAARTQLIKPNPHAEKK